MKELRTCKCSQCRDRHTRGGYVRKNNARLRTALQEIHQREHRRKLKQYILATPLDEIVLKHVNPSMEYTD